MNTARQRHAVIGLGRLGSTLYAALTAAGLPVAAIGVRDEVAGESLGNPPRLRVVDLGGEADVFWLSVPDDEIYGVAARLASGLTSSRRATSPVAIHTSGLGSVRLLDPLAEQGARCLSLHPLQTFAGSGDAELLRDVPCAVTADDERDRELGEQLATTLTMKPFRLADEQKRTYHLAACVASNLFVALESEAKRLLDEATGDENGLAYLGVLLQTTLNNLVRHGDPAAALTGPVARGDVGTVRSHLRLLANEPQLASTYRTLSLAALALAAPRLDEAQHAALSRLLEEPS